MIVIFVGAQATPQSYGNSWNWNMTQNGPATPAGPPGQGNGYQGNLFLFYELLWLFTFFFRWADSLMVILKEYINLSDKFLKSYWKPGKVQIFFPTLQSQGIFWENLLIRSSGGSFLIFLISKDFMLRIFNDNHIFQRNNLKNIIEVHVPKSWQVMS